MWDVDLDAAMTKGLEIWHKVEQLKRFGPIGTNQVRDQSKVCKLTVDFPSFAFDVIAPRYLPDPLAPKNKPMVTEEKDNLSSGEKPFVKLKNGLEQGSISTLNDDGQWLKLYKTPKKCSSGDSGSD